MSAAGKRLDRIESDFYPTPQEAILPMLEYINTGKIHSFFEPCRGSAAISKHFDHYDKYYCELSDGLDYFEFHMQQDGGEKFDLIVTNPPFHLAMEFLEKSLIEANTVIYLLRLDMLGSEKRKPFWDKNPPTHLFPLSKRPVFCWVCKTAGCKAKYHVGHDHLCSRSVLKDKYLSDYHKKPVMKMMECGGKVGPGTDATDYGWFVWDRGGIIKTDQFLTVL